MSSIRFVRDYPHPVSRVWDAIATQRGMSSWLMPTDFEPRQGHRFTLRWKKVPGWRGFVECEVLEIVPQKRLVFSWVGDAGQKPTRVTFELQPQGAGTRLVFEHTGFEGIGGFFSRLMMKNGWGKKLLNVQLNRSLETLERSGAEGLTVLVP